MLRLELHCLDFMDRVPVERAVLRVALQVVPNYWQQRDLTFLPDPLRTAVLPLDGLQPSTLYDVQLSALEAATGSQAVLARGQVRTPSLSPTSWTIAFTSCQLPSFIVCAPSNVRRRQTFRSAHDGKPHPKADHPCR